MALPVTERADVVIVGGGIVGLATAHELTLRFPGKSVVVLEKEPELASHQTGHNSGVLHTGIYYRPGSLKARNCRDGKQAMQVFCAEQGIPFEICGKVIVAVSDEELPRLDQIYERGRENGVVCELIDRERLREIEPHTAGIRAINVPEAGIVDYRAVCRRLAERVVERGGRILLGAKVRDIATGEGSVTVTSDTAELEASFLVNSAGLHSDRVAKLGGAHPLAKIVPFRGEYFVLSREAEKLCRNLIYPVPDPSFPFLGVHFTRMIGGGVECGPNAVLAFAREGYTLTDINVADLFESLTYSGFLRLAARYWRVGAAEMWRSLSKSAFVRALQRLVPEIRADQLERAPAGVRAQAITTDGNMVDDFLFQESGRILNVLNAPSPAATASLNIGRLVVDRLAARF